MIRGARGWLAVTALVAATAQAADTVVDDKYLEIGRAHV